MRATNAYAAANTAMLRSKANGQPKVAISEIGARLGSACHHASCTTPTTEPTMKNSSVRTILVLPPPTENKVPDAQPPPSCMPTPKRKDPTATDTPTGETNPTTG